MLKPSTIVGSAFLLLSIVGLSDPCSPQGGVTWQRVHAGIPPANNSHAMAYDAARQRVVLFGPDTWEWDGVSWTQATPAQSPSRRSGHAMAYDAARQRVVLFGGLGFPALQDTWEWDGANWTQATPAQSPSARWDHAMAYDATRQRMVLFGGSDGMSSLSDTWECHSLSPALFTSFGTGCPGSLGVPSLGTTPFSSPWTGDTFSIDVTNLPFGAMSFMVTGLSNTFWAGALIPLSAPLMSWGMPGCTAYTDVVNSELLVNTTGTATWSTTIPNNANLIGLTFYNQGFIIEPGVNALGAIVSNAGEAVVGMR